MAPCGHNPRLGRNKRLWATADSRHAALPNCVNAGSFEVAPAKEQPAPTRTPRQHAPRANTRPALVHMDGYGVIQDLQFCGQSNVGQFSFRACHSSQSNRCTHHEEPEENQRIKLVEPSVGVGSTDSVHRRPLLQ